MRHIVTVNVDGCEVREIALDLAVASWDQQLQEGLQGMGQVIAGVVLEREDVALREAAPAEWENLGREARELVSLVGRVVIRRRVYRDGDGVRHKPLDEALGLSAYQRATPSLQRLSAYQASGASYRRAAETLSWQVGYRINATRIQKSVWAVGQQLAEQEQAERAGVFERGQLVQEGEIQARLLYAEADGVWISLQREGKRKTEVRVAILYSGKERLGKGRWRLVNKVGVTALVKNSQEWQEMLLLTAFKHYQLSGTQRVILNGDGSEWVRHSLDRLELPLTYQLDRFHLMRAAREAGPGLVSLMSRACQEGLQAVEESVRALIRQADAENQPRLLDFYAYVKHNADGLIDYRQRLGLPDQDHPGMGAIEGNVDKLVVQRLKGRGMSWRLAGAKAMLALCRHRQHLAHLALPPRSPTQPQGLAAVRPLDHRAPSEDDHCQRASVPILHSSAENTPLGRTLRGIVNGEPETLS